MGTDFNPVDPAHIRIGLFAMQMKSDDAKATPLCREDHTAQHAFGDEASWWKLTGLDPFEVTADGQTYVWRVGRGKIQIPA